MKAIFHYQLSKDHEVMKTPIRYTLNFDLLTPPYDNMKEVTV
jgi:hypothetical protein